MADTAGVILPAAAFKSNTEGQRSFRLNTAIKLNAAMDMSIDGNYSTTQTSMPETTALLQGIDFGPAIDNAANLYGYSQGGSWPGVSPLAELSNIGWTNYTGISGGGTLNWRPSSWFVGHITAGIDHGADAQTTIQYPTGDNSMFGNNSTGSMDLGNVVTNVYSFDARATATATLTRSLSAITSVGLQMMDNKMVDVEASTSASTLSNMSLDGCYPSCYATNESNETATLGGYLEEQLNFGERLFLIGGLRVDAASGFGTQYSVTEYPKASISWVAIKRAQMQVRFRGAVGASGQQPQDGASQTVYQMKEVYLNGQNENVQDINWPGNPNLKPERSTEYEAGVDFGGWDNRVSIELTAYNKLTTDALISLPLGGDVGSYNTEENIGTVQNSGAEVSATLGLLAMREMDWEVTVNASVNHNKLVSLPKGLTGNLWQLLTTTQFGQVQYRPGYPVGGLWGDPIRYVDVNHDGIIEPNEVLDDQYNPNPAYYQQADFVGAGSPTREASVSTHVGLWRGAVSLQALVDYRGGYRVDNQMYNNLTAGGSALADNVPTAPLWQQAEAQNGGSGNTGVAFVTYMEDGTLIRFRELSLTYSIAPRVARSLGVVQNLSLTGGVRNLALWTRYSGVDPETFNSGYYGNRVQNPTGVYYGYTVENNDVRVDWGSVPLLRDWMIRLNVGLK